MKKELTTLGTITATGITYLSVAGSVFAQNLNPCPVGQFGGLCNLDQNQIGPVISGSVTILLIAAALIALFFLIWGGIRWITSGGDKGKVDSARGTITAAIIGLIIALLAFFITTIVLGLFNISLFNLQLPSLVNGGVTQ